MGKFDALVIILDLMDLYVNAQCFCMKKWRCNILFFFCLEIIVTQLEQIVDFSNILFKIALFSYFILIYRALCKCISSFFLVMVYFFWYIIYSCTKIFCIRNAILGKHFFFLFKQTPKKSLIKMFVAAISRLSHDTLYANDPHFHTG